MKHTLRVIAPLCIAEGLRPHDPAFTRGLLAIGVWCVLILIEMLIAEHRGSR